MKSEELFEAMTHIDDQYLLENELEWEQQGRKLKSKTRSGWSSRARVLVACACLLLVLFVVGPVQFLVTKGNSEAASSEQPQIYMEEAAEETQDTNEEATEMEDSTFETQEESMQKTGESTESNIPERINIQGYSYRFLSEEEMAEMDLLWLSDVSEADLGDAVDKVERCEDNEEWIGRKAYSYQTLVDGEHQEFYVVPYEGINYVFMKV